MMRASHIPINHEGSRWEESWKDPEDRVISSTTRADAAVLLGTRSSPTTPPSPTLPRSTPPARLPLDSAKGPTTRWQIQDCLLISPCGQQHRNAVLISDGEISMVADCYHCISFVELKLLQRHTKILM